jgi:hypothetical protein
MDAERRPHTRIEMEFMLSQFGRQDWGDFYSAQRRKDAKKTSFAS